MNESFIENSIFLKVLVWTTALTMCNFIRRDLSVAGGLINTNIYSCKFHLHDVSLYNALQCIAPGEWTSIVVLIGKLVNIALALALKLMASH